MAAPIDADARVRALAPDASFIVQAPAGSGKTELLTRRILTLLARVDEPEEILAITFTRKAASEMRQRVVEQLVRARAGEPPEDAYQAEGLALARHALARDAVRGWRLIDDPQRLNLRTIDSLATQLAQRLPVLSTLGAPAGVQEDARALHVEAARRFVDAHLDELDRVLLQLGNRFGKLQELLADLLAVRDQWMRYVPLGGLPEHELRDRLEGMLGELVESRLRALVAAAPAGLDAALPPVAARAAEWLRALAAAGEAPLDEARLSLVECWESLAGLPGAAPEEADAWRAIAHLLMTQDAKGAWRRSVDKRLGFPAKGSAKALGTTGAVLEAHKAAMLALLGTLDGHDAFRELLHEARSLPSPRYADDDWALLMQLVANLPLLLAELQLVFAEAGVVDFVELSQRAVTALGGEGRPTDLALAMDLTLSHVLVDEFQDTSKSQFALFERLVAGWSAEEGKTFFVVGDPMQSIYRFREGDVALFLQAQASGIGGVALEPLTLRANFRSAPPVIDWVNAVFAHLFPAAADADVGAVTYASSHAHLDGAGGVELHALPGAGAAEEAARTVALVAAALELGPARTVGLLVRMRSHARAIVPLLRERGIRFRALDMDPLGERPVVRDLIALTLALRHPHDRLSWLAVLRGPLCGLTLADLHALIGDDRHATLIERLDDAARVATLSEDGRGRVARFMRVAGPAMARAARAALVPWVEAAWLALGGPSACEGAADLDAAERCLSRLAELEADGRIWARREVVDAVAKLYASDASDEGEPRVQLMTLHRSKGLEFDTVIIPGLVRPPRRDDARLFDWSESTLAGRPNLLLAPIDPLNTPPKSKNPLGRLVRGARARADTEELRRLLYVGCTRAKSRLHLVTTCRIDADGVPGKPPAQSLLAPLADVFAEAVEEAMPAALEARDAAMVDSAVTDGATTDGAMADVRAASSAGDAAAAARAAPPRFVRTTLDWALPAFERHVPVAAPEAPPPPVEVHYEWRGTMAREVGTVVHRALLGLASRGGAGAVPDAADRSRYALELRNLGVGEALLDEATKLVERAIGNTLADDRGRWILDERHAEARSEWALTVPRFSEEDGRYLGVQRVIVDRTFVDAGTRWIVDYKTGSHEGADVDAFLERECERYAGQLQGYVDIMRRVDARPLRVGLWFPMVRGWVEFPVSASAGSTPAPAVD